MAKLYKIRDSLVGSFGVLGGLMFVLFYAALWFVGILASVGIPVAILILLIRLILYNHI